ncbi:MAG: SDR family NAD(P)-dependent oxidoreductase [Myxococcota bacterium]
MSQAAASSSSPSPSVLVVGASSGFGAAAATRFLDAGFTVVGTSRRASALTAIDPGVVNLAPVDVTDQDSVDALLAALGAVGFRPSVLVLNAGYGEAGPVEASSVDALHAQLDTNLYGVHRLVGAFLPSLRETGGRILIVGSLAARVPIPFQALYSASKAAVASYAGALRQEVMGFGIHVTVVEPGDHATAFGASRTTVSQADYEPQASLAIGTMEAAERAGGSPDDVARVLVRLASKRRPPFRRFVGSVSERFLLVMRALLPHRWFERMVMWHFAVPATSRGRLRMRAEPQSSSGTLLDGPSSGRVPTV